MKLAKDLAFYLGVEREDEVVETIPTPQVSEKLVELPQTEEHPKPMPVDEPTKTKSKHQTAQTLEDYVERFLIPHKLEGVRRLILVESLGSS